MIRKAFAYLLKSFGEIRQNETRTVFLMFLYSFLVMAAYNVIKPATRSKFIENLGPDNLPYVQLAAGAAIGLIMAAYTWGIARLPRRWCLSFAQAGVSLILLAFWFLFRAGYEWVPIAFYLAGLILGILLISQFWALANVVFDPRQAKRLFGVIGGGSSLGGILGSYLAGNFAKQLGTVNLLLFSVCFMASSIVAVTLIVRREGVDVQGTLAEVERGPGSREAMEMLRKSKHLRLIALVISLAAIGAAIIEQQLNMAAASIKGQESADTITVFLANVQLWTSAIGLLVQVLLTSRIHQHLGIGFALLLLPAGLGSTAVIMLFNAALWAPGLARVIDQSLRYTVDKTTREILYMPLPPDMKLSAKPFVDVTVDRIAKGMAAVLLLFLIKPWGLELSWQRLSYASIATTVVWIVVALQARRGYQDAFRNSIHTRQIKPAEVTPAVADLSTIETLIQELASPDEQRVLYGIEFLESLGKQHLITPLLLYHESPEVRARALSVIRVVQPEISSRWLPAIQAMMRDPDPYVRSEAVGALATLSNQQVSDLVRPLLDDKDPRIALTAALVLAAGGNEEDSIRAEGVLSGLVSDTSESAAPVRREFAVAIRRVSIPHFRRLLIPLLTDPNPEVADEAMRSTRKLASSDFIFVPTLISLLGNRRQKSSARELLTGYAEAVLPILGHFLLDPGEGIWVRRHIPATIARIPCRNAMDILFRALEVKDGFLHYQVIAALERIHRIQPELLFDPEKIESLIHQESARYAGYRRLQRILLDYGRHSSECLLARATSEKMNRGLDRIYRLLSLLYPWKDIVAARQIIEKGDARSRAGTLEYLDNILAGSLRKTLIPLLENVPPEPDQMLPRDNGSEVESAVLRFIHDKDPVLASAAMHFARQQRLAKIADDLDRMLAFPDAWDRRMLETASWALQGLRRSETREPLAWLEQLPAVELADQLRRLPLFGSVTVDEVFRICETGRQMRYEPGQLLYEESQVPQTLQFLLQGRVSVTSPGAVTRVEAPSILAFQEVLEEKPMSESVRTAEITVCLTLTMDEIRTLLSHNSGLVRGLFQMLCRESGQTGRVVVKGHPAPASKPVVRVDLSPIEKGLVLKTIPLFSHVSPDEILALAAVANEVLLTVGSDPFKEAGRSSIYALISGAVTIETGTESTVLAGPSDVIGIYETIAGIDFEVRASVREGGLALRIDREELFDLLSQRSALLRQVFRALFRGKPAAAAN